MPQDMNHMNQIVFFYFLLYKQMCLFSELADFLEVSVL